MVKLITKLYKYYIFDITIAIVFLIIGDIITVPPTFSKYFDNSITSQKLVAGFLEKDDVNLTKINADRDDKLKENVKFKPIDVSEDFPGIDFKTFISTLSDLHLENFQFSDNLSNTNMNNSYSTSKDLIKNGNLSKANLATANLYGTNLTDADLTGADLTDADLTYADLINANLTFTYLKEAILIEADLTNATLQGADLTNTILLDTNLTNADVSHAKFNGTFFNCASLKTTNITNLTNQNIILLDSNFNKITSC
jgi:uncharacterized protein YjbI with pentapeptide repeats